jgi:hypothetical protein
VTGRAPAGSRLVRPIACSIALARVLGTALCLAGASVLAAQAGEIQGTVRGVGGAPLPDRLVGVIGPTGGAVLTDGSGHYSLPGLAAGTYFVKLNFTGLWSTSQPDPNGLVGELYSKIPCPLNGCTESAGTEVAVPASGSVTIDFDLRPGSRIQGTITASGGGPLAGIDVRASDLRGRLVAVTSTDGSGSYTLQGIPAGSYYINTYSFGARADRVYAGFECANGLCDPTSGAPVAVGAGATRTGVNFVLPLAAAISGTIRNGGGPTVEPLVAGATVEAWLDGKLSARVFATGADGTYLLPGLTESSQYHVLAKKPGLVTSVHNGASPATPCPASGCDIAFAGIPVAVFAGATTAGIDVELLPGFSISGSFGPSPGLVRAYGASFAGAAFAGTSYTIPDLPPGTYHLHATARRRIGEWWNDQHCPGDFPCLSHGVAIGTANVGGIDFTLDLAGEIRGNVTDSASGDPLGNLALEATWSTTGTAMSAGTTEPEGTYVTGSEGLPPGTYRVRTLGPRDFPDYRDEIWDDTPCEPNCALGSGDPVTVTAEGVTTGVDFGLQRTGVDFYTLPPCRVWDSRLTPGHLASGVAVALRAEAACGIPGHALAISANVTVVGPTADGVVAIWPFNLPVQPPTSVLNFRAGRTRANNAMLGMSLSGLANFKILGALAGGGSYDLIIDVNGFFAPRISP